MTKLFAGPSYYQNIPYFSSTLSRLVKIDVWYVRRLGLVGINLCAKNYQSIPKVSRVMAIFANCHTLALALPRSRNSGVWQILRQDLVNINVSTKFYQNIVYG